MSLGAALFATLVVSMDCWNDPRTIADRFATLCAIARRSSGECALFLNMTRVRNGVTLIHVLTFHLKFYSKFCNDASSAKFVDHINWSRLHYLATCVISTVALMEATGCSCLLCVIALVAGRRRIRSSSMRRLCIFSRAKCFKYAQIPSGTDLEKCEGGGGAFQIHGSVAIY